MLADFQAGKTDAIANMTYTDKRAKYVEFSAPTIVMNGAIFVRKTDAPLRTLSDLRDRRVAVKVGGAPYEYLLQHGWADHVIPASTLLDGLRLLVEGKADAVLDARIIGLMNIRDEHFTSLEASDVPVMDFAQRLHIGLHRAAPPPGSRADQPGPGPAAGEWHLGGSHEVDRSPGSASAAHRGTAPLPAARRRRVRADPGGLPLAKDAAPESPRGPGLAGTGGGAIPLHLRAHPGRDLLDQGRGCAHPRGQRGARAHHRRVAGALVRHRQLCPRLPSRRPGDASAACRSRSARGEIDQFTMEKRYLHPGGKIVWALLSLHMYRHPNRRGARGGHHPGGFFSSLKQDGGRAPAVCSAKDGRDAEARKPWASSPAALLTSSTTSSP